MKVITANMIIITSIMEINDNKYNLIISIINDL